MGNKRWHKGRSSSAWVCINSIFHTGTENQNSLRRNRYHPDGYVLASIAMIILLLFMKTMIARDIAMLVQNLREYKRLKKHETDTIQTDEFFLADLLK